MLLDEEGLITREQNRAEISREFIQNRSADKGTATKAEEKMREENAAGGSREFLIKSQRERVAPTSIRRD